MKEYSTEYVMDFYKRIKYKNMEFNKFFIWDYVQINSNLTHDKGYEGQLGIVYDSRTEDSISVMAYNKVSKRYWVCGFDESEIRHTQVYNFSDSDQLVKAAKDWFCRNDKAFYLKLLEKENSKKLDDHKYYKLNFQKLSEAYNIEWTLLKILFEETPITLDSKLIKKYGLQNYVVR